MLKFWVQKEVASNFGYCFSTPQLKICRTLVVFRIKKQKFPSFLN